MGAAIGFVLSNFTLVLFIAGLVAAGITVLTGARRDIAEALLAWFVFFSIGVSYLYNFVIHVFFGDFAARFIGWENSPFQAEVGYASLGFAAVGFLAFRSSWTVRLAAILGPAFFLWGAAVGHVIDMVTSHNFAPGNAGTVLWTDILLPVAGFVFLWRARARG